jgi:hypothetical protein
LEMPWQLGLIEVEVSKGRLRGNRVQHRRDQLQQQTPVAGPRQAASGTKRGEVSNASTSGSSSRIINR